MPTFELVARAEAPVEEVWKLLHDPARFPQWWSGVETVRPSGDGYTMWPTGYPDFPMPQRLRTDRVDGRVTISCLVSDLQFVWQLREAASSTDITVRVSVPDAESHRMEGQRELIAASLARLATLAAAATPR